MRKIFVSILTAIMAIGMMGAFAGSASAQETPTLKKVYNGMWLGFYDPAQFTGSNPIQGPGCTLGAVGTDKFGNLVGITAGHCTPGVDQTWPEGEFGIWDRDDVDFGPIGHLTYDASDGDPQSKDYMVIKFDPTKVELSSNGPALRVDALWGDGSVGAWANICKDGNTTGKTCGLVNGVSTVNGSICSFAVNDAGDSGGPVVVARNNGQATEWVGITTRRYNPGCFPYQYLTAKAILSDLNPKNIVGSGFTIANTP